VQHLDREARAVGARAERIAVHELARDHGLRLDRALDRAQPVAQPARLFEALRLRGRRHLRAQLAQEVVGLAAQEQDRPAHERLVRLVGDPAAARRSAAADRVLEAGPALAPVAAEHRIAAGAQREDPLQRAERAAQPGARGVRAEVERSVARELPRLGEAWIGLGRVEAEREVLLVVAQPHVEARLVLLDQLVLEEQRLLHVRGGDHLEVGDAVHQERNLVAAVAAAVEVAAHARAQALRLADVEHGPLGVAEDVDAGLDRQRADALFERAHRRGRRPFGRRMPLPAPAALALRDAGAS
jgi:hypothetical protein